MVRQQHQLNGHECEHTPGESGAQRSPTCCSPWGHRVGHDLVTEQQQEEHVLLAFISKKMSTKNPNMNKHCLTAVHSGKKQKRYLTGWGGGFKAVNSAYNSIPQKLLLKINTILQACRLSHSVMSDSFQPHGLYPTRLLCPWDFPGKNPGVGCHFLLQGNFPIQRLNPFLAGGFFTTSPPGKPR